MVGRVDPGTVVFLTILHGNGAGAEDFKASRGPRESLSAECRTLLTSELSTVLTALTGDGPRRQRDGGGVGTMG